MNVVSPFLEAQRVRVMVEVARLVGGKALPDSRVRASGVGDSASTWKHLWSRIPETLLVFLPPNPYHQFSAAVDI